MGTSVTATSGRPSPRTWPGTIVPRPFRRREFDSSRRHGAAISQPAKLAKLEPVGNPKSERGRRQRQSHQIGNETGQDQQHRSEPGQRAVEDRFPRQASLLACSPRQRLPQPENS